MITASQYQSSFTQMVRTTERIEQQCKWITEGVHKTEWPHFQTVDRLKRGTPPSQQEQEAMEHYLKSLREIQFHIEGVMNYVTQMTEDAGLIPVE